MKELTILVTLVVVLVSMIMYFIVQGRKASDQYEPPFKYKVNGNKYSTEYGAKCRVKYLKSKNIDFQVRIFDGISWVTFSPNTTPPGWTE